MGGVCVLTLHVDDGGDVLDEHPVAFLRRPRPLFGLRPRRDVHEHALPVERGVALVADQHGLVVDPAVGTVRDPEAVLDAVGLERAVRLGVRRQHSLQIVRVQVRTPEAGGLRPLVGFVSEELRDLWAQVHGTTHVARGFGVYDHGDVLDQRSVALFALREPLLGQPASGDVHQEPLPGDGLALLVDERGRHVVDPDGPAVGRDHPVLGVELDVLLRGGRLDPFSIVGVDDREPEVGIVAERLARRSRGAAPPAG